MTAKEISWTTSHIGHIGGFDGGLSEKKFVVTEKDYKIAFSHSDEMLASNISKNGEVAFLYSIDGGENKKATLRIGSNTPLFKEITSLVAIKVKELLLEYIDTLLTVKEFVGDDFNGNISAEFENQKCKCIKIGKNTVHERIKQNGQEIEDRLCEYLNQVNQKIQAIFDQAIELPLGKGNLPIESPQVTSISQQQKALYEDVKNSVTLEPNRILKSRESILKEKKLEIPSLKKNIQTLKSKNYSEIRKQYAKSLFRWCKNTKHIFGKAASEEPKHAAHILNAASVAGTDFNGYDSAQTASYYEKFIDKYNAEQTHLFPYDESPSFAEGRKDAKIALSEIAQSAEVFQGLTVVGKSVREKGIRARLIKQYFPLLLKKLRDNNSAWIAGGWAGIPQGHAMAYRLETQDGGKTYSLSFYNTGAGVGGHTEGEVVVDGKSKIFPVLTFKGIPRDDIFKKETLLSSPKEGLFKGLWGSLSLASSSKSEDFGFVTLPPRKTPPSDLHFTERFENFFSSLLVKQVIEDADHGAHKIYKETYDTLVTQYHATPVLDTGKMNTLITEQRSGTCSQQVLRPVVGSCFKERRDYKVLSLEFKMRTLIQCYQKHKDQLIKKPKWRMILKDRARQISTNILKIWPDDKALESADSEKIGAIQEMLQEIQQAVSEAEQKLLEKSVLKQKFQPPLPPPAKSDYVLSNLSSFATDFVDVNTVQASPPSPMKKNSEIKLATVREVQKNLPKLVAECDSLFDECQRNQDFAPLYYRVNKIISSLPFPDSNLNEGVWGQRTQWNKDSLHESLESMNQLQNFLTAGMRYMFATRLEKRCPEETITNVMTAQLITFCLSRQMLWNSKADSSYLENYCLDPLPINKLFKSPYLSLESSPAMAERLSLLRDFVDKNFQNKTPLFGVEWRERVSYDRRKGTYTLPPELQLMEEMKSNEDPNGELHRNFSQAQKIGKLGQKRDTPNKELIGYSEFLKDPKTQWPKGIYYLLNASHRSQLLMQTRSGGIFAKQDGIPSLEKGDPKTFYEIKFYYRKIDDEEVFDYDRSIDGTSLKRLGIVRESAEICLSELFDVAGRVVKNPYIRQLMASKGIQIPGRKDEDTLDKKNGENFLVALANQHMVDTDNEVDRHADTKGLEEVKDHRIPFMKESLKFFADDTEKELRILTLPGKGKIYDTLTFFSNNLLLLEDFPGLNAFFMQTMFSVPHLLHELKNNSHLAERIKLFCQSGLDRLCLTASDCPDTNRLKSLFFLL